MSKSAKKEVGVIAHKSGVAFRVWAPFAESVAVIGVFNGWSPAQLTSEGDGYWYVDILDAKPGQEYKYVIQSGGNTLTKNDPRSMQVTTSDGNSVVVEPDFDWGDISFKTWPANQQVVYEMHIGTFNRPDPATPGTFESAGQKLGYLAELGVTAIEVMPVGSMSMDRGWGYSPDYIYAVEALYGGRHQFLEFIKAAHQRGIAVILDVVYNHFGPDGGLDLWQFDGWSENDLGGIYFYNDWRAKTPWGNTRPDYGRAEVRQYILDNVRMWLNDFRLDGLRVDSTIFMRNAEGANDKPDTDIAEGWTLLQDINKLAKKIRPESLMVAEDIGYNDYLTKPAAEGGAGFDAQWAVNFHFSLRSLLDVIDDSDRDLTPLCEALAAPLGSDASQKIIYGDSHDSAAHGGARLAQEIAPANPSSVYARKRCLLGAALILTAPGIPMLLQGQEFMQSGSFNDWEALDWQKADRFDGIVEAHQHLIALRKNQHGHTLGLTGQAYELIHRDDDNKVIAYHRWQDGGPKDDVVVVINFANRLHQTYDLPLPRDGTWQVRFNSAWRGYSQDFKDVSVPDVIVKDGKGSLVLPPYAAVILSQDS